MPIPCGNDHLITDDCFWQKVRTRGCETRTIAFEPAHGLKPGHYLVAATQTDFAAGHSGTWRLLVVCRGEVQTAEEFDRGHERLCGVVR